VIVITKEAEGTFVVYLDFMSAQPVFAEIEGETDLVFIREAALFDHPADILLHELVVLLDEGHPIDVRKKKANLGAGAGKTLHEPGQRQIPRELHQDRRAHLESAMRGFVTVLVVRLHESDVGGIFCLDGVTYLVGTSCFWEKNFHHKGSQSVTKVFQGFPLCPFVYFVVESFQFFLDRRKDAPALKSDVPFALDLTHDNARGEQTAAGFHNDLVLILDDARHA